MQHSGNYWVQKNKNSNIDYTILKPKIIANNFEPNIEIISPGVLQRAEQIHLYYPNKNLQYYLIQHKILKCQSVKCSGNYLYDNVHFEIPFYRHCDGCQKKLCKNCRSEILIKDNKNVNEAIDKIPNSENEFFNSLKKYPLWANIFKCYCEGCFK